MSLGAYSEEFLKAFQAAEYGEAVKVLPQIKYEFAKAGLLSPAPGQLTNEDYLAARQLLELGVLALIHDGCTPSEIIRLITQMRPFYNPALGLPKSDNETKVIALHLLLLLTNKQVAEFHTELEMLEDVEIDQYLSYAIDLERWLMEGAYNKAWAAVTDAKKFPAPEFAIMTHTLQDAIRNEIAACAERAYVSLPLANARHLMFVESDADLNELIKARGWTVSVDKVTFQKDAGEDAEIATDESLISDMLRCGAQIENII